MQLMPDQVNRKNREPTKPILEIQGDTEGGEITRSSRLESSIPEYVVLAKPLLRHTRRTG